MKSGVSSYTLPAKRRWKGLVIGVLGLVILSMLVPLVFLLGLHNGFHSPAYEQPSPSNVDIHVDLDKNRDSWNQFEDVQPGKVDELLRRLKPPILKEVLKKNETETENKTIVNGAVQATQPKKGPVPRPHVVPKPLPNVKNTMVGGTIEVSAPREGAVQESEKLCELKFGSYCLWRQEHKEEMKDFMVKKLKDQLFVARAYFPSVAKLPGQDKLSRELRQNIQELERILSETTTDADLPPQIEKKLQRMDGLIAKSKSLVKDCNNVDKKLRQIYEMTEDEANFHMRQSAFLYQVAVQTTPKSLHCLSMRTTVEYFRSPPLDLDQSLAEKYTNPSLHHYVLFSKNVLASSVVISSTVMNAKESRNLVFHVLTDKQNYFSMKLWFYTNTYNDAMVEVINIEDVKEVHLSLPEEFRVSFRSVDNSATTDIKTEYISVFSHSHFLLPEIFKNLKKVVVLDDDVVVQQDLSGLWNLNMEGKVVGAMQYCKVRLGQLKNYLGESSFDGNSCAWMSGLNIVDLVRWREKDVTGTYRRLLKEQKSMGDALSKTVALRTSLLSLDNLVYGLDAKWALSGLGHDYGLDNNSIKRAAVLHYNGNMKPWLDLGIPRYRGYWKKFVSRGDQFLMDCNIN